MKMENEKNYMGERLTGVEAYRALYLCLNRWYDITKNEYVAWLISQLSTDQGLMFDWEQSIKEVIEERKEYGDELHLLKSMGSIYRPCKCQDEDTLKHPDVLNAERNIPR
jgi:hypothetical protein